MDILERDYFGLKYLDVNSVSQWLDARKPIKKQSKDKGEKTATLIHSHYMNYYAHKYTSDICRKCYPILIVRGFICT